MRTEAHLLVTIGVAATIALVVPATAWSLDCARVQKLTDGGMRPAEVARELGITTPDVQACLAGVVEVPQPGERRPQRVPFNIPGSADELRRPPNT